MSVCPSVKWKWLKSLPKTMTRTKWYTKDQWICSFYHTASIRLHPPLLHCSSISLQSVPFPIMGEECWHQSRAGWFMKWRYRGESKKKRSSLTQGHHGREEWTQSPTGRPLPSWHLGCLSWLTFCRLCTVLLLCVHACVLSHFSHVWLFVTLWTLALQASLSMGFSRQEYWSG